jgi:wyosine [tRNA(Phe)-imidazoG37] synthetase (radical SAM superfamily)
MNYVAPMIVARRRLTTTDHAPDIVGMTYVYAVVSRRAGGVSVGVNLNPNDACNWRCAYCQVEGLVLGAGPPIDLALLSAELRSMLEDIVHGDFLARSAPEGARVLKDVAFAGNGEPTTSPDFGAAIDVTGRVLAESGLLGEIPVVLITNGTQVNKPDVAAALGRLAALRGEVWFKLDTATTEGMRRINHAPGEPEAHLAKLRAAAPLCPTWIQTCLVAWDGEPPSEAEQNAYLGAIRTLVQGGVPLRGVLLYSASRASKQPDAQHVSALSEEWLRAFAARIAEAGLPVRVTP